MSTEDKTITMTCAEWAALQKHVADLERSAASAREIARVAMLQTKSRCLRAEVVIGDGGISVVICDPSGDEIATAQRIAGMLDKSIWSIVGVTFIDKDPIPSGSTA